MSIEVPSHIAKIIEGQNAKRASGRDCYDEAADAILSDPQVISRIVSELVPGLTGLTPDEVERKCLVKVLRQPNGDGAATVGLSLGGRKTDCPVPSHREAGAVPHRPLPSIREEDLAAAESYVLLHRVVSVWVIVEPHGADRAAVAHTPLGTEDTDLLDIIYVRLNTTGPGASGDVVGMPEVPTSGVPGTGEKKSRLKDECGLEMSATVEGGVNTMGRLSEAIFQRGWKEGKLEARAEDIITCMRANDCDVEGAMALIGCDRSEWPHLIEAVNALQERERDAEHATE